MYNGCMFELPLFPLNTVLFPGMPLPLHIFEDRYKQMIQMCLDERRPFGVVYIRRGESAGDPAVVPHGVGCSANIIQVQPLEQERLLIMTVGQERFRIVSLQHDRPYLVGMVESAPLDDVNSPLTTEDVEMLRDQVLEYLDILSNKGDVEFDVSQISTDPQKLIYLAAAFLQIPQEEKQPLLEINRSSQLLGRLSTLYREELSLMRLMPEQDQGLFSLN
jgi:Lon protease-like protein